jgi:transposase
MIHDKPGPISTVATPVFETASSIAARACFPHPTWRHLNFFQHEAYLHARVPRVRCDKCGIKTVNVPWA